MRFINKLAGSLSSLSSAFAQGHITHSYCRRCGRDTRWIVNLGRGYFRCTNCQDVPGYGD